MMEAYRAVMRRKRHVMGSLLKLDDSLLDAWLKQGLLSEGDLTTIKQENNNQEKVCRLVELVSVTDHATFDKFCDVVGSVDRWLQEELIAEVKAELGTLQIEGYIQTEAAMLVHRRFGRSRRISEIDKRQMASLMASKMQSTKEACRRQLAQTQQSLQQIEQAYKQAQTQVESLSMKLKQFIRHHDVVLCDPMLDMRSTTQALFGMTLLPEKDALAQLEDQLEFLLGRFSRLLAERSTMVKDRQKLGDILKLRMNGPLSDPLVEKLVKVREENESLVKYLRQKVISLEEKVNQSEATVEEKEKVIGKLRADMEGLENELATFKHNIETMNLQRQESVERTVLEGRKISNSSSSSNRSLEKKFSSSSSNDSFLMGHVKGSSIPEVDRLSLPPIHPGTPMSSPAPIRKRFHRCSSDRNA